MIHSLEDKSKKELVEIVRIQQEHDQQREKEIQRLQAEVGRLRRVNDEHAHNLTKIIDYCKSKGIGKIGQSCTEQLIASHETAEQRVKELEAVVATAIHTFNEYEMDVDMYPTIEHVKMKNGLHEALNTNKFATEQQIKALDEFIPELIDCIKAGDIPEANYEANKKMRDAIIHVIEWAFNREVEQLRTNGGGE